jgi:hypothetical protein
MQFIRASRVDFFNQHSSHVWKDNLASLGFVDADGLVFCNLAAISGPLRGKGDRQTAEIKSKFVRGQGEDVDRMMDVRFLPIIYSIQGIVYILTIVPKYVHLPTYRSIIMPFVEQQKLVRYKALHLSMISISII